MKSPNVKYVPGIDHLRAVAALLVIHYHGMVWLHPDHPGPEVVATLRTANPLLSLLFEGHTAISLFMVLTGFVFSVSAVGKDIVYLPFIRNRFLRIYPLFVIVTLLGVAAFPARYTFLGVVQALAFQANYPGGLDVFPFSGIYWALAVEFQFYLVFPFLHRIFEREGIKWALLAIVLANVLRSAAFTAGASNARDIVYSQMPGRIDQFLIGMLAARVHVRLGEKRLPWGLLSLGSVVLVFGVIFGFHRLGGYVSTAPWKLYWPTVDALMWAAVTVVYVRFAERVPRLLAMPFTTIGTISYSTYLLHVAALVVVPRYVPLFHAADANLASLAYTTLVVLPLFLPVAGLSYYVIERPFLALRTRYLVDRIPDPLRPA